MINIKTKDEIETMRQSCLLVGKAHAAVIPYIKPGATTLRLNEIIEEFILDMGAKPSFKNYHGYPYASCISVNDSVVHGFPSRDPIREGDVISIDIGVLKNGFHGDSAYSYALGPVSDEVKVLLRVTKESLYLGIEKAVHGNRVGDVAAAIQEHTEKNYGFGVVRELVGHGLGRELHEDPQVPNYGKKGSGIIFREGMVIAIEPMINLGKRQVYTDKDGWTVRTSDGKVSAHFEHDVCVAKGKADILSSFEAIELEEKRNQLLISDY